MTDMLLTVADAAARSGVKPRTVRRAIAAGALAVVRLGSGAKSDRIHPRDLDAWWARRRTLCQSPSAPKAVTRLPSATADERIASLLAPGRSPMRRSTSAAGSRRSATLQLVSSRSE
ncbi:MAG: helix-turn-helix domain-containing protein [Bradyrhizobium sp.]|nr:helix-turn-helix domain-containing protein [Bradyrhizobium sp.]